MSRIAQSGLLAALTLTGVVGLAGKAQAEQVYGVTINDFLVNFDSTTPGNVNPGVAISGLQAGEHVVAMDVQPGTRQLYALGSNGRLYTLDTANGEASFVGRDFGFALSGSNGGMDFNHATGNLHLVSSSDRNLIIDAARAETTHTGTAISFPRGDSGFGMDPNITQIASRIDGELFGIDTGRDVLVGFGSLASGDVMTIGDLGVDATESGGFDISPESGLAYAAFRQANSSESNFFILDLATGAATPAGVLGTEGYVTTIAVAPEPASAMLVAIGVAALSLRRMKR